MDKQYLYLKKNCTTTTDTDTETMFNFIRKSVVCFTKLFLCFPLKFSMDEAGSHRDTGIVVPWAQAQFQKKFMSYFKI